jgi:acid phosphatase type 7
MLPQFSQTWLASAILLLALPAAGQVTVVAVGDIACDTADVGYNGGAGTATRCHMLATSNVALSLSPAAVLLLGDNQYDIGALAKYQASFDPSWGRLKAITRPAPGNHEYGTPGAQGYFDYFGMAAGDPAKGWYSSDLAGWHLVALNSNCAAIGGCTTASPQGLWLAADLAAHPGVCTLAFWHHPRFSSGPHGNDSSFQDFWTRLRAAGADLILNGHDHGYERFAPQSPTGAADPGGPREFVVGTGGKDITSVMTVRANSEVRNYSSFGILELKLYSNGYEWRFLSDGGSVLDSGHGLCHSALPAPASDFYTVPPCRLVDTRDSSPMTAGVQVAFPAAGTCGVPADATAIVMNATVINPTVSGNLKVYPSGLLTPQAGVVNFSAQKNRGSSAIIPLGVKGEIDALISAGTAHVVLDVSGYFR